MRAMLPSVRVGGAHIRVSGGRYLAGLVVVDDREVIRAVSLPAPADSDEGRQLEELYTIAHDLLAEYRPEYLAVKVAEPRAKKDLAIAHRGEGAVFAAAGVNGIPVKTISGAKLRAESGLKKTTNPEAVAILCDRLSGEPTPDSEVAQAAAAVVASWKKSGG